MWKNFSVFGDSENRRIAEDYIQVTKFAESNINEQISKDFEVKHWSAY
jgi:hypothetical protein